ncbi:hypothetical protein M1116_02805 [Patescibacteria group bacterium]|nr:hypothetical protein [Patescibacteria group bacterium]
MKKISRYLLFLSIITFVAVIVVIVQQSYDKLISSEQKVSADIILKPIKPQLDTSVLDNLEKKEEFTENDLNLPPPPLAVTPVPGFRPAP